MTTAIKKGLNKGSSLTNSDDVDGAVVDPRQKDKYLLQVTAGPSYDALTHGEVQVNSDEGYFVENEFVKARIHVKIKDYNGLPKGSPSSSDYFDDPLHKNDRYSISYSFIPKKPIPGTELIMGYDFDRPIRDRLPPGFRTAMKFVTTIIDPGIYSDPYADKPYLYGAALSSFFQLRIGEKTDDFDENDDGGVIEEGAEGSGQDIRDNMSLPETGNKRRKMFLKEENQKQFEFEEGRVYRADFYNPYLDFANFGLRLPIISISVARFIDEKTHNLRYVLKNKRTGEVYFVVVFTLLFGQALEDALAGQNGQVNGIVTEQSSERSSLAPIDEKKSASSSSSNLSTRNSSQSQLSLQEEPAKPKGPKAKPGRLSQSFFSAVSSFFRTMPPDADDVSSADASGTDTPPRLTVNQKVEKIDDRDVEEYLRDRHSTSNGR